LESAVSRRFRVEVLPEVHEQIHLDAAASHHLLRVLTVPRGQFVVLFDGEGRYCEARLVGVKAGQALVEGYTQIRAEGEGPDIVLLQALCKGQAFDSAVRMGTELGVCTIVPVITDRCIAKGDRTDRWKRIAESAAAQSGRSDVPVIAAPTALRDALLRTDLPQRRFVAVVNAPLGHRSTPDAVAILLGPEGGLTADEIEQACAAGFTPVSLGCHVLRAETATAAALSRYAPTTPLTQTED
jgi:16S rRNA (uracil1498-N3)-methyltransferase